MTDAFVVGAGFSAAISSHMPVMRTLAGQILDKLEPSGFRLPPNLPRDDFETWLTYLSADQPWLSERDNLLNRAAQLGVVEELRSILNDAEDQVREADPPDWLCQLAVRWHRDRAWVLTLNYDTLVEAAHLRTVVVRSTESDKNNYVSYRGLYPVSITPAGSRSTTLVGGSPYDTFRLLKLHGSTNWFYSGRSSYYGESIYDGGIKAWQQVAAPRANVAQGVNDKVPLIVPPTAGKSAFFNNETVRAQWKFARDALEEADRVYFLGYSMPNTDELMRFMIGAACANKPVFPVNIDAGSAEHYQRLLPDSDVRPDFLTPGGLKTFVEAYDGDSWEKPVVYLG